MINLDKDQIQDVKQLMAKYHKVFAFNGRIGKTHATEHRIDFIPGAQPITEPSRRHAEIEKQAVREQIADMLKKGIIEESTSPWASLRTGQEKKWTMAFRRRLQARQRVDN